MTSKWTPRRAVNQELASSCSHSTWETVRNPYYDPSYECTEDEFIQERRPTIVDISLHAYQCTQCGWIGYYSGAGRIVEEEGVSLDEAIVLRAKRERHGK